MRTMLLVAAACLIGAANGHGQAANRSDRFSAALGVVTPGVHPPVAYSASLSARMRRSVDATLVPQVDVTASSDPGTVGNIAATVDLVYRRPVAGFSTYALVGAGMLASYTRSICTGGIGSDFSWRSRALFAEFRAYGPTLHDMSGFRFGFRF